MQVNRIEDITLALGMANGHLGKHRGKLLSTRSGGAALRDKSIVTFSTTFVSD